MKKILSILGLAVIGTILLAVPAYAAVRSGDTIDVRKGETINDDLFAAGSEVIIDGTVDGDVYAAASRLVIRGAVNGDVIAVARFTEITGSVRDDVRIGGETVSLIGATIGDSVTVGGSDLSIDRDTTVGGGVVFGGQTLLLDGMVGRGIMAGGEKVRIDGSVGRTVRLASNDITLGEDAIVNGDMRYQSGSKAAIKGKVTGSVVRSEPQRQMAGIGRISRTVSTGFTVWAFLAASMTGLVLLFLFPHAFERADRSLYRTPGRTFGIGALVNLLAMPVIVITALTIIGIPMAIIALTAWILVIYLAKFFVGYSAGKWLLAKIGGKPNAYLALMTGLAIFYLMRLLPVLGLFVSLASLTAGTGMFLSLYKRNALTKQRG